jgi:hypothetical protein
METTQNIEEMTAAQLARLADLRKKDKENSKFLFIDKNESVIAKFDPLKMKETEREFEGHKTPVIEYEVILPELNNQVKILQLARKWSRSLWKLMEETRKTVYRVKKTGEGFKTKYEFEPIA